MVFLQFKKRKLDEGTPNLAETVKGVGWCMVILFLHMCKKLIFSIYIKVIEKHTLPYTLGEMSMTEKQLEQKLIKAVKDAGGLCLKWISPGWAGAPDRICLLPGMHIGFVEVKAPGMKPRPLQKKRHTQLRVLGFPVYVLDDPDQIPEIIGRIRYGSDD